MRTKEEIKKYILNLKSFKNFIHSCCYNTNVFTGEVEEFKPYKFQEKIIQALDSKDNLLINSARQMGTSTLLAYYILYTCIKSEKKVIYFSESQNSAKYFFQLLAKISELSFWEVIDWERSKNNTMIFKNGSYIKMLSPSPSPGKGEYVDVIVIDNAAYNKELSSVFAAAVMATDRIVIASTPNKGSYFNKLCSVKKTQFKKIILPWHVHDKFGANKIKNQNYDLKNGDGSKYINEFYANTCYQLGNMDHINQELNCMILENRDKKKKVSRLNLRLPDDIMEKLNQLAVTKNKNVSEIVRDILSNHLL